MEGRTSHPANPSGSNSSLFGAWIGVILHPKETFKKEKPNASLKKALLQFLICGLFWGLSMAIFASMSPFPVSGIFLLIAYLMSQIGIPVEALILSGIVFLIAKAIGGKGNYTTQTYLISVIATPISIVLVCIQVVFLFMVVKPQGFDSLSFTSFLPVWAINLAILAYSFYLVLLALKEAHS